MSPLSGAGSLSSWFPEGSQERCLSRPWRSEVSAIQATFFPLRALQAGLGPVLENLWAGSDRPGAGFLAERPQPPHPPNAFLLVTRERWGPLRGEIFLRLCSLIKPLLTALSPHCLKVALDNSPCRSSVLFFRNPAGWCLLTLK